MELVGRIKVNSIVKPMFLKVTDSLSEQFRVPVDEKNRAFVLIYYPPCHMQLILPWFCSFFSLF